MAPTAWLAEPAPTRTSWSAISGVIMKRLYSETGFTLVELAVTILIISVLVAVASLMITSSSEQAKFDVTTQTMQNIRTAIMGDREITTGSQKSSYGYFGDVGWYPATLNDLITQPGTIAAWTYNTASNTASGWNGPYLQSTFSGAPAFVDGWGHNITIDPFNALGTDPAITLRSAGPDGISGNADDITLAIQWSELIAIGTVANHNPLTVNVSNGGVNLSRATVSVNYPNSSGTLISATEVGNNTANQGQSGNYVFNTVDIPYGPRSIQVTLGNANYGPTPIMVTANNVVKVDLAGLLPQGWGGGLIQITPASVPSARVISLDADTTNANSASITIAKFYVTWTGGPSAMSTTGTTFTPGGGTPGITSSANTATLVLATPVTLNPNTGFTTFRLGFNANVTSIAAMSVNIQALDSQGNIVGSFVVYP